ncbi:hypothetical protein ISF_05944 [Cordyceps fumosorosea ARSEF 2679]|uniref:NADH dehydrogenase (Ubiquinone)-like protein n=1 Tax=Cordyceps fumosorosea (strain ARSEF 2679) TaxID=1081104 RepID=A0A167SUB0_CORFA|nr:hypothetical protein ISF_05944 [Cordyceps fumosorosea ARSEF 2679]OAA59933.1 hypothetical protein ISF_05944 [Cordyceps fumosorosea ARSEF 2679]
MRYEEWDILLFPRDGKVPLKEFKVACHVVHDNELSHIHGSLGLPTVCCFVPSLPPSAPYKLSIHSWSTPPISQFTRSCGKFVDRVVFEVRLFVDGRLVSSSVMNRADPKALIWYAWSVPNCYDLLTSPELSETGELNSLTFPVFQRELLDQSYWSPADDLGRIKVVISESYPRDSLTVPFERVKNIVAFSFQHAPLEILESSAIAWPNASMFRAMPFTASALLPTKHSDSSGSHAHSPRPRSSMVPAKSSLTEVASDPALLHPGKYTAEPKPLTFSDSDALSSSNLAAADPFVEANAYFEWLSGIGMGLNSDPSSSVNTEAASRVNRKSSTDASMPDYVSCVETPAAAENRRDSFAPKINSEGDSSHMKVPTNTPTTCDINITEAEGVYYQKPSESS